ncbi:hypothetical protein V6Z77_010223 [Aspergillus fumigatus]
MRRPAAPTAPAHRGSDDDHPIAPTVAPQEPVRTQVIPSDRPRGRGGCGIRLLGCIQTPRTAVTRRPGGSRNLAISTGQRPTIQTVSPQGTKRSQASVIPACGPNRAFLAQHKVAPGRGSSHDSGVKARFHCRTP